MVNDSSTFCDGLVDFEAFKVKNIKPLWVSYKELCDLGDVFNIADFAYVNPKSSCFVDLHLDVNNKKILQAERYGGVGVGGNGGGVRCGNTDKFQLKGIGINPLLGDHDDYNHSTGNYSLSEAVSEVINSQVYGQILPVGVAQAYGLVSIGKSRFKGDPYGHRLDLAIMAREICVRPAHFLPQPFFKPFARYKSILMDDVARVRSVNKALAKKFENNNVFIMYLGKYLSASANQLAFAKVFRIAHGAYSPSNVCFDGRWLDLTNMSMVPAGTNYAAAKDTVPFLAEPQEPIKVVQQVVYNYSKYNFTDLNIVPLVNYYYEQFNAYFLHYLIGLFGLDCRLLGHEVALVERQVIAKYITKAIDGDRQVTVAFPSDAGNKDVLEPLIEDLFLSLGCSSGFYSPASIQRSFNALFVVAYRQRAISAQTEKSFVMSAMIRSLRKLYFAPCFYLGRMKTHITQFIALHDHDEIAGYIDSYALVAAWLFDKHDLSGEMAVYMSPNIAIEYSLLDESFSIKKSEELLMRSSNLHQLQDFVGNMDAVLFEQAGYCFKAGLLKLLSMLSNAAPFCAITAQQSAAEYA